MSRYDSSGEWMTLSVFVWVSLLFKLFFGTPIRAFITVVVFLVWNISTTPPPPEKLVHPKVQAAREANDRCSLESFGMQVVSLGLWNKRQECSALWDTEIALELQYPDQVKK